MKSIFETLALLVFLTGHSALKIDEFSQSDPKLDLFKYFDGRTEAWGIFEDRFGNLRRQFRVSIEGTVESDTLTLDERFDYADGGKDRRVWRITRRGEGTYSGEADDVIGRASGIASGNALYWQYKVDLKVGESIWRVAFDDWMFLQEGGVLINRARVTKWGVQIGEVSIFFSKPSGADG